MGEAPDRTPASTGEERRACGGRRQGVEEVLEKFLRNMCTTSKADGSHSFASSGTRCRSSKQPALARTQEQGDDEPTRTAVHS